MSTRMCEFFGGPSHGQKLPIDDTVRVVDLAVMNEAEFIETYGSLDPEEPIAIHPTARYTRVYHPRRTPTAQFEYIGKVTP